MAGGKVQIATSQGNGNSAWEEIQSPRHVETSHVRTLLVWGTFAGATVKYQVSEDAVQAFDVSGADAITAAKAISVSHRCRYHRINVSGGGGTEAINAMVV